MNFFNPLLIESSGRILGQEIAPPPTSTALTALGLIRLILPTAELSQQHCKIIWWDESDNFICIRNDIYVKQSEWVHERQQTMWEMSRLIKITWCSMECLHFQSLCMCLWITTGKKGSKSSLSHGLLWFIEAEGYIRRCLTTQNKTWKGGKDKAQCTGWRQKPEHSGL